VALPGATAFYGTREGIHGEAAYPVEVPEIWNDVLVVYAHGYRGPVAGLTVSTPSLRPHLIANGYAWAASSFSVNFDQSLPDEFDPPSPQPVAAFPASGPFQPTSPLAAPLAAPRGLRRRSRPCCRSWLPC
jgi:hypothetical protein